MKVWQKIILGKYYDIEAWNLDTVKEELLFEHNCPARIENEHGFIGEAKFKKHCNLGCGVECLREYLDYEIVEEKRDWRKSDVQRFVVGRIALKGRPD